MSLLKKMSFLLFASLLIVSCSSDSDDDTGGGSSITISNLDFSVDASGSGNIVSVLPTATGATSYSVDFGTDGNDAGAWNSNVTLSVEDENLLSKKILISYNRERKIIRLLNTIEEPVTIEIYNLLGSRVLALNDIAKEIFIDANAFKNSIYILKAKVNNKFFSKKFIIY